MQRFYRSAIRINLCGQCDSYETDNIHVIPALVSLDREATLGNAPEVSIWSTGAPRKLIVSSRLNEVG